LDGLDQTLFPACIPQMYFGQLGNSNARTRPNRDDVRMDTIALLTSNTCAILL
jgi:hypothetical protein